MKKIFQIATCAVLATACGKTIPPSFKALPPLQPTQVPDEAKNPDNNPNNPDNQPPNGSDACDLWLNLPASNPNMPFELTQFSSTYQIVDNLELVPATKSDKAKVLGTHRMVYLPEVMYNLSTEVARGNGQQRTLLDPITLDQFIQKVNEAWDKGELPWYKKFFFDLKKGDREWLAGQRNEQTVSTFEESLPGIFTGNKGDLSKSQLFADLLSSAQIDGDGLAANFNYLTLLSHKTALFKGTTWADVNADIGAEIKVFAKTANHSDLPMSERFCRFAVQHRLLAQLVALKGVSGTPRIRQGLLVPLPTDDIATYPVVTLVGAFSDVLSAANVGAQAGMDHPDLTSRLGGLSPLNLIAINKTFSDLQKTRSPEVWTDSDKAPAPAGELRLPQAFLQLTLGLQVISMKQVGDYAVTVTDANRVMVTGNDSEDALSDLGEMALTLLDSVDGLKTPTAQDLALFSDEQIEGLVGDGTASLAYQVNKLMLGVGLEGLQRISQENRRSDKLLNTVHKIGYRLNSAAMTDLQ